MTYEQLMIKYDNTHTKEFCEEYRGIKENIANIIQLDKEYFGKIPLSNSKIETMALDEMFDGVFD